MIMNPIDFDLLKILVAVAETRNFREAAEMMKLSQPAISLKMKQLEEQLPYPIFQFQGKKKVLTPYGEDVYRTASQKLKDMAASLEGVNRRYASTDEITLRLGGRFEVLECIIPKLDFSGRTELFGMTSSESLQKLNANEIDISVSHILPDSADLIAKKLFVSSGQIIVHKKWLRKTGKFSENAKLLSQIPCILYYPEEPSFNVWLKHLGLLPSELKIKYVAEDWRTVKSLVEHGFGYAVVPNFINPLGDIAREALPPNVMPKYSYYAIFKKHLRKIQPLQKVLSFQEFNST
jgi:DNA-binding transcriptional LysR family regulator